jgi:hypothetical protein
VVGNSCTYHHRPLICGLPDARKTGPDGSGNAPKMINMLTVNHDAYLAIIVLMQFFIQEAGCAAPHVMRVPGTT